jgi:hypothetical protein
LRNDLPRLQQCRDSIEPPGDGAKTLSTERPAALTEQFGASTRPLIHGCRPPERLIDLTQNLNEGFVLPGIPSDHQLRRLRIDDRALAPEKRCTSFNDRPRAQAAHLMTPNL